MLAGTALVSAAAGISAMAGSPAPNALPTGGRVTAGQASIAEAGSAMTITQTSPRAILDWQGFDIGKQAAVTFRQPDASAMALNRVTAGDASQIEGKLSANGQVVLVNPNGVVFGAGATVNAGGLVASALDIKDADFLAGNLSFQRDGATGAVTNHGKITTARGGYAALVGAKVTNDGLIEARLGTVALASGEAAVLSFDGTSLVGVQVQASTVASLIEAGGIIRASGGKVLLSAAAANQLLGGAINADGIIEASSLSKNGGKISLQASGPITIAGAEIAAMGATGGGSIAIGDMAATASVTVDAASRLDASATGKGDGGAVVVKSRATAFHGQVTARGGKKGGNGGHVETSGDSLDISGARVDVAAPLGGRGTWLLDPTDFVVDANAANAISNALSGGSDVTISTTAAPATVTGANATSGANAGPNGDIVVASSISWGTPNTLTLSAARDVLIDAPVSASGDYAGVSISTPGSLYTGNGGSLSLPTSARLSINGQDYKLINSEDKLAGATSGYYALGSDITLANIYSNSVISGFSGTLEGLGHTISGLVVNGADGIGNLGLIGINSGILRNLTVVGSVSAGSSASNIGLLAGQNLDVIDNVGAIGTVNAGDASQNIGGLVGSSKHPISYSYFAGSVVGGSGVAAIGGLVGLNSSTVLQTFAFGTVSAGMDAQKVGGLVGYLSGGVVNYSFSAVAVGVGDATGVSSGYVGGLIGLDEGQVGTCYATGGVVSGANVNDVGGLIGKVNGNGSLNFSVTYAYAGGAVTGGANAKNIGGLIGNLTQGAGVFYVYATGAVAGGDGTSTGGLIGKSTNIVPGQVVNAANQLVNTAFWDTDSSGQNVGIGSYSGISAVAGLSDAGIKALTNNQNFSPTAWFSGANGYPQLVETPFVLQVKPANKSATYGDAVPAFTATYANFWPGDAPNFVTSAPLLTSPAGATPAAGSYPITASGPSFNVVNGTPYQVDYTSGSLTVAKKALTWTVDDASATYGTVAAPGPAKLCCLVGQDQLNYTVGVFNSANQPVVLSTGTNAGSYQEKVTGISGAVAGNYSLASGTSGTLTIKQAPLVITADSQTMTYGGTMPGLTASYNGWVNGDTVANLTSAATVTSSGPANANAGVYTLSASGAQSNNYAISYQPGTLTITQAPLTVTADSKSMTYGGTMPALTASYSGFVNGDTVASLTSAATVTSSGPANSNAGVYTLSASGAQSNNYAISYQPGTLTITQAPLTVTADSKSMTYGGTMPALTASYSGFVNGDTVASLTSAATVTSSGPANSNAGVYTLSASGAQSNNYAISYQPGTLTIDRRPLVITAADAGKVYGQTVDPSTIGFTALGLVNGDSVASVVNSTAGAGPSAAAGGYAIHPSQAAGSGQANYDILYRWGTLTVAPQPLTWSVADAKALVGTLPVPGVARLSGVIGQDQVSASVGLFTGGAAVPLSASLPVGSYSEMVTGLAGPAVGNYILSPAGNTPGQLKVVALPSVNPMLFSMNEQPDTRAKPESSDQEDVLVDGEAEGATDCENLNWRAGFVCKWQAQRLVMPASLANGQGPAMLYSVVSEVEAAQYASDQIMP